MIRSFRCAETEGIFNGLRSRRFQAIERIAYRKLAQLHSAAALRDLSSPPANRLEALRGDRAGQQSLRINDQYRLCFRWEEGAGAYDVEIVDYH